MFVLSITNLARREIIDLPFFSCEPNCRWIYSVSQNYPLLSNYKMKLESFTPEYLRGYLHIEILDFNSLNEDDIDNNFTVLDEIEYDKFYLQGTVNGNRGQILSYDDFTMDKWENELRGESNSGILRRII